MCAQKSLLRFVAKYALCEKLILLAIEKKIMS